MHRALVGLFSHQADREASILLATWILWACIQQAPVGVADGHTMTMPEAVSLALSLQRHVVAAQLQVEAAQVDTMAARLWPNPQLNYSIGNLVLGAGNDQERDLRPTFFEQRIQTIGIEQSFDVWRRRWARLQSARAGVQVAKCQLQDVLREVVYQTRSAYLAAAREELEYILASTNAEHWQKSAELMARRLQAGDIAASDLAKIELEALRAKNAVLEARKQLQQARQALAAQMGVADSQDLPKHLVLPSAPAQVEIDRPTLIIEAMRRRPDLKASQEQIHRASSDRRLAVREALPDINVGLSYTRSLFMISGDNPHSLGVTAGLALPLADRNQPGRAMANIALRAAQTEQGLLRIEVQRQVAQAVSALHRAKDGMVCFEGEGLLAKAEQARAVAHRALQGGAFSLLDVLEAERTALEIQAEFLAVKFALHQAYADLAYATFQEAS